MVVTYNRVINNNYFVVEFFPKNKRMFNKTYGYRFCIGVDGVWLYLW